MVPLFRGVPLMLRWYSVGILGCFAGALGNVKLFRGVPLFRRCFVFRCSVFRRSWFYSVPFNTLTLNTLTLNTYSHFSYSPSVLYKGVFFLCGSLRREMGNVL